MNYSDAKEEVLETLTPKPGERYIIDPKVLGTTALIQIDMVTNGMISYTVIKCIDKPDWLRPVAQVTIRVTSWWQAQNDGNIHADPDASPRRRIRRVQGVRP